jgi:2-polyprenyl-3-methyl-5-hydroxy-6-metoxy-1,4-benzoquinol methylase
MKKYNIPKGFNKPKWVIDHFDYLNKMDKERTDMQKCCNSELTKICEKYKNFTDKGPDGPYYIKHNYTEIYGDLLRHYKDREINLLEIGVRQGGSLCMWSEYLPKAHIHGIDINLSTLEVTLDKNRITTYQFDAYNPDLVEKYFKDVKFDVILDDGSHSVPDQKKMINIWSKYMKDDGILIIEDIKDVTDAREIILAFDGPINKCSIIDRTHCVPSLDDVNVIYYK